MLKQELRSIWKDKKFTLSIIVMMFIPILYSGMLLWAFWDPYSNLDELPVALVNEDSGAVLDGEAIALGKDLVNKLIDEKQFHFFEVSSEEAKKRLLDQDYYLLIKIPENFSEHATTLLEDHPEKLQIEYLPNEGYNFLGSKIGDSAIEKIRIAVNEEVAKTYAETLYESINQLSDGFDEATDGATTLRDGAAKVKDGSIDLKDYLQQLAESSIQLSEGTNKLAQGINDASEGASKLAQGTNELAIRTQNLHEGVGKLTAGASDLQQGVTDYTNVVAHIAENQQTITGNQTQLHEGATTIASNTAELAEGTLQLVDGATAVHEGVNTLAAQLEQLLLTLPPDQQQTLQLTIAQLQEGSGAVAVGLDGLAENSKELSVGATNYVTSSEQLLEGQQQLTNAASELVKNSPKIVDGSTALLEGQNQLATNTATLSNAMDEINSGVKSLAIRLAEAVGGSSTLADGTSTLVSKSEQLSEGAGTLVDGTVELTEGAEELKDALQNASVESDISYSDETVNMTVSPVEVNKEVVNKVANYGSGFAPYFISLGLFVGALLLTNVYPFIQPSVHPTSFIGWYGSKTFIPFVVIIGQIVLIIFILKFVLGLQVASTPLLILTTIIVSFAFMAIIQMLTVILGDVGRFAGLLFLIVQLTSSAGTFPVELLPSFFQKVHNFMPMKYAIQAYRDVISGQYTNFVESLAILIIIGVVCVATSISFFAILFKRCYSKQPT